MPSLDRKFIDDLLSRIDIVELISNDVELKKAGANFKGLCPFHSENTPSFNVSQTKQFYHCFGCGASGDAIKYLREAHGLTFMDAIEKLASIANVEIPKTLNKENSDFVNLFNINDQVKNYFKKCLEKNDMAKQYLASRGFDEKMIDKFEIGYASESWDSLKNFLEKSQSINSGLELGLLIKSNEKVYDRFRNRIMFPIKNTTGKTIAFGGRALDKNEKAKYINSPESKLFYKSSELYGLYESAKQINKLNNVIIVEGYTDVISLYNNNFQNSVASLGTAFTKLHLQKLKRYSKNITFCFDGDKAGHEAAWKALQNCLEGYTDDLRIGFCFLGDGLDPDQLARSDPQKLKNSLNNTMRLSEFLISRIREHLNLESPEDASRFVSEIIPHVKKIPSGVFKKLMLDKIEKITSLDKKYFYVETEDDQAKITQDSLAETIITPSERLLLDMIFHYPSGIDDYYERLKNINANKFFLDMLELAKSFKTSTGYNLNRFLDADEKIKEEYLRAINSSIVEDDYEQAKKTIESIISQESRNIKDQEYRNILTKYTNSEALSDSEKEILKNYKK